VNRAWSANAAAVASAPKSIGSSLNAPRCILSDWGRDFDVATIRDASPEKLSFVLPRTIGATGCRIADLTRRKLFRPKNFALPRHLRGNGWAWETVGSNVAPARKRATAPTLILQSSRMANLLILSPRSTVGFLPERRGSLRRPFYSSLLPELSHDTFFPAIPPRIPTRSPPIFRFRHPPNAAHSQP
jgi:hypothetical protein